MGHALKQTSFIVEFLGLPGVGKSTLTREAVKALNAEGFSTHLACQHPWRTSWLVKRLHSTLDIVKLTLRKPYYVYRSSLAIHSSKQHSYYDQIKVTHNWMNVSAHTFRANHRQGIILFDQGMFQALWSVGYSARVNLLPIAIHLNTFMPKPDLLVLVQAEASTVVRRLLARGEKGSRLDPQQRHSDFAQALSEAAKLLDELAWIAEYVSSQTSTMKVLKLDNNQDGKLHPNTHRIVRAIRAAVQGEGAHLI